MNVALLACLLGGSAAAERYVIKADMHLYQPTVFRVLLNGQPIILYKNIDAEADITRFVKAGKNTLVVEFTPGKNSNMFSKSTLTLGAGENGKWRTLFKKEVNEDTTAAGKSTFVFMAKPDSVKAGKVSLFGKFHPYQPTEFEILLNGESINTMNSDGNYDITPFLKSGKNDITVKYKPGKNSNLFSQSVLTVGQQMNDKWASLLKLAVGEVDTKAGSVTLPIYR